MSRELDLRKTALTSLRVLVDAIAAGETARKALRALDPDTYQFWLPIPPAVEGALVDMIDEILGGDKIASYLLYECNRGGGYVQFPDGVKYPIVTLGDVERLLKERYPVAGEEKAA